jgi:S-formylglutathione hydrolase FrmB
LPAAAAVIRSVDARRRKDRAMPRPFAALIVAALCASCAHADPLEFHLTFDKKALGTAFTGRAYVMLFAKDTKDLRPGPDWMHPEPFFSRDVKNVKAGEIIVIDKRDAGYPVTLDKVKAGTYTVQAVIDLAPGSHSFSRAPGNVYTIERLKLDPASSGAVKIHLDQVYKEAPFKETDRVKLMEVQSKLLTAFHKRPTKLRASVALPDSFAKGKKTYPVVYEIPGFSGTHRSLEWVMFRKAWKIDGVEVIHVMLDPDCHHGHHVFADSANNGPVGKALVEELIPALEKKFRGVGKPEGRFVMGHSSGGWSSLWLQVAYPDFFGGCWSTAPDPVDFRDFQRIDLYRDGENMFTDGKGNQRPLARSGGKPVLWYKSFSDMEEVMGHGGQLASFEACFSERGKDGQPKRLWDRKTGKIDTDVAKSWEKYDVRLILEKEHKTLGPKLKGKLHVYAGGKDTFYLDGAVRLLKASQEKLKSDAKIEVFEDQDHSSLLRDEKLDLLGRVGREMAAKLRAAKLAE